MGIKIMFFIARLLPSNLSYLKIPQPSTLKIWATKTYTVVHDFRTSAKTMLQEQLKHPSILVEMGLGHITKDQNGTAYDRFEFLEDRTEMMKIWADYLDVLRCNEDVSRFKNRLQDNLPKDPEQLIEALIKQLGKDKY